MPRVSPEVREAVVLRQIPLPTSARVSKGFPLWKGGLKGIFSPIHSLATRQEISVISSDPCHGLATHSRFSHKHADRHGSVLGLEVAAEMV